MSGDRFQTLFASNMAPRVLLLLRWGVGSKGRYRVLTWQKIQVLVTLGVVVNKYLKQANSWEKRFTCDAWFVGIHSIMAEKS